MKLIVFKALILALYLTTLAIVWNLRNGLDGFWFLLISFSLAYCGIIVLAHLVSALVALCPWCVAATREKQSEKFTVPSVVFETESEAT